MHLKINVIVSLFDYKKSLAKCKAFKSIIFDYSLSFK
jgi:hypothetical protein